MMPISDSSQLKTYAIGRARELGFVCAGIAAAVPAPHAAAFETWLSRGDHASMSYLARNREVRRDVRAMEPWVRSVLCLAASYAPGGEENGSPGGSIARYARGRDYHKVLKAMAHRLADDLSVHAENLQTRVCVDTAPILERDYAHLAGLGWIGNNGCLIHPQMGSYLLLAEILLSVELPPDQPMRDHCGTCRRCLDACPNGAIIRPRELDARRCISWATIEHRGELDAEAIQFGGSVFGCDICQQVCPFNGRAPRGLEPLCGTDESAEVDALAVLHWSPEDWDLHTRASARRRASYAMYLRNACIVAGQSGQREASAALTRLAEHEDASVRAAANWAIAKLS